MSKILTSYHPPLTPIIKNLAEDDHEILTLHADYAKSLTDLDLEAKPLGVMADGNLQNMAYSVASNILGNMKFSENGLGPGISKFMGEGITSFLYPRLSDSMLLLLTLKKTKPDLVILHNDIEPITRMTALWAKSEKVPCLHIPHAIYQDVNRGGIGEDIHDLITASHLAVSGSYQREWYEARGLSSDNIRETGLPQFDAWANLRMTRERARRLLKIPSNASVITYASTWRQDTNILGCNDEWAQSYLNFLEAVKKLDVFPIVKLHPRSDENAVKWHIEKAKEAGVRCVVTHLHLPIVLFASDAILAYGGSNVLLEASFIPNMKLMIICGYSEDEAIVKVGLDDMAEKIHLSFSSRPSDVRGFQAKYLGIVDGKASDRITDFARELL